MRRRLAARHSFDPATGRRGADFLGEDKQISVVHELGHLAADSLCDESLSDAGDHEAAANAFAAELLLPEAELRSFDWHRLSLSLLADHLTGGCCESRQVKHRAPSSASGYLPAVKFGRQLIRVRIEALAQRLRKIPAD